LNTSFNDADEPIVCSPQDAIRTFLNTDLDALVLGSWLARKTSVGRE
jgi:carbamoyltransferase